MSVQSREMSSVTVDVEATRLLVAEAQNGDRVAAERLIREHEAWVRSAIYAVTGRSDVVDDIAQQVWARVWQRLNTLESPQQLRPWLYTVARNTALDAAIAHRRQQNRACPLDGSMRLADPRTAEPTSATLRGELRAAIVEAVQALPAIYREPFVLRHLEEWSYAEIAEAMSLTIETVETRLVRARRMLREMLKDRIEH